jgi:hypothetical protein
MYSEAKNYITYMEGLLMKFLTYNQIMAEAANCGNGRIIRVGYSKEMSLIKAWAEKGIRVYKLTETSVRLGVNYGNIATVKARKAAEGDKPKVERANNFSWVIPNKVKYNSNTGKTYLQVATLNGGHNTRNQFLIYDPATGWFVLEREEWETSEYYLMTDVKCRGPRKGDKPEVYTITFGNIFKLGNSLA